MRSLILGLAGLAAAAQAWTFVADSGVRTTGVSVEAISLADGSVRLYAMGGPTGVSVARATDGLAFAGETATVPRGAIDPAIVRLPDGRWRMYYVKASKPLSLPIEQQGRELRSAVSDDALSWTEEPGVRLSDARLHGVPEVVALPAGGWRLYYAARSSDGRGPSIWSAVSSDGLTFTPEGERTPGNYYDPAVAPLGDGWVLLAASNRNNTVRVFVGRSTDGLQWALEPDAILDGFDPTLLPLGNDRFRVYYSTGSGPAPPVLSGVLAAAPPPPPPTPTFVQPPPRPAAKAKPKPKPKSALKCKQGKKPPKTSAKKPVKKPVKKKPCRR